MMALGGLGTYSVGDVDHDGTTDFGHDIQISGSFSEGEAKDLALVLRAGSLPAPLKVMEARNIGASLGRSLPGFAIGSALGAALGLAAGVARWFDRMLSPAVFLTYPVPKIVMLPIFMIWFGIGDLSKILIIALACFYPVFINAYYGARFETDLRFAFLTPEIMLFGTLLSVVLGVLAGGPAGTNSPHGHPMGLEPPHRTAQDPSDVHRFGGRTEPQSRSGGSQERSQAAMSRCAPQAHRWRIIGRPSRTRKSITDPACLPSRPKSNPGRLASPNR